MSFQMPISQPPRQARLLRRDFVTTQEGVQGDASPHAGGWGVPAKSLFISTPPQAAREAYLNSYGISFQGDVSERK
jgi:hypothetical protein